MSAHKILIDSPEPNVDLPDFPGGLDGISQQCTLRGTDRWSVHWRRLRGGLSEGVLVVEICNGPMTVSILPTRGMGLWKIDAGPIRVGWDAPYPQPVHPGHVDLGSRNGLGWLDGFSELLCRCGLASNGPPGNDHGARSPIESQLTLHGRIANTPAHTVAAGYDPANGALWVQGIVDECTLFGPQLRLTSTLMMEAGSHRLTVIDEFTNLSSHECECQLLYHLNVGPPLLEEGSQIHCAHRAVCPRDIAHCRRYGVVGDFPRSDAGLRRTGVLLRPDRGLARRIACPAVERRCNARAAGLLRPAATSLPVDLEVYAASVGWVRCRH